MKDIAVIMGSRSDWSTMALCCAVLDNFSVAYDTKVVSAHRTPLNMIEFAQQAKAQGYQVIIAAAGGAAHLPGMVAAVTSLPVIGVPIQTKALNGVDSLLSIAQMPAGVPVMTMAINGAQNAAYSAISILALQDEDLAQKYLDYKKNLAEDTWSQQFNG